MDKSPPGTSLKDQTCLIQKQVLNKTSFSYLKTCFEGQKQVLSHKTSPLRGLVFCKKSRPSGTSFLLKTSLQDQTCLEATPQKRVLNKTSFRSSNLFEGQNQFVPQTSFLPPPEGLGNWSRKGPGSLIRRIRKPVPYPKD